MANSPDLTPERFFNDLYDQTCEWLMVNRQAELVAEFSPHVVRNWSFSDSFPRNRSRLSLDLQKGDLLHERPLTTALLLSRAKRSTDQQEDPTLSFQFGFLPTTILHNTTNRLEQARMILDRNSTWPYGEIYQHPQTKNLVARNFNQRHPSFPWPSNENILFHTLQEYVRTIQLKYIGALIRELQTSI